MHVKIICWVYSSHFFIIFQRWNVFSEVSSEFPKALFLLIVAFTSPGFVCFFLNISHQAVTCLGTRGGVTPWQGAWHKGGGPDACVERRKKQIGPCEEGADLPGKLRHRVQPVPLNLLKSRHKIENTLAPKTHSFCVMCDQFIALIILWKSNLIHT